MKSPIRFLAKLILSLLFLAVAAVPAVAAAPYMACKYYCLMDAASGQVILSQNADKLRPVASTTKMMTAILTVDYSGLSEKATVSENADHTPEFTIGLRAGQKVPVSELLNVSVIRSSNDAAVVLAEHVAGDEELFAHLMSLKAFAIGAMNTHFKNASGLPAGDHYSTAYDLGQIGRYALSYPQIRERVGTKRGKFAHPGYGQPLDISNTNGLLGSYPGADGIKTGTADAAGKCLVASATRGGRQLIAVALKSGDRTGDCARLLDYGFNNSVLTKIIDHGSAFKHITVINGEKSGVDIYPQNDLYLWTGEKTPNIEKRVKMVYQLQAPVSKGKIIGIVQLYADGKLVKSTNLICGEEIRPKPNLIYRAIKDFLFS
ncbi:MAG: D-alanyl-D-alanine carboxypeptidase family protein [Syntrophomonas sp.]